MGLIAAEHLQELAQTRRSRALEDERRSRRYRADAALRSEPLANGRRDPLGPRTDAPKGVA